MKQTQQIIAAIVIFLLLGSVTAMLYNKYQSALSHWLSLSPKVYSSQDPELGDRYASLSPTNIQWSQLIPDDEKAVLQKYQQPQSTKVNDLTQGILLSIQASSDEDYQAALRSTNSVANFDQQGVSIAGFIVPIDYADDNSLRNIFIVPYFGACLHFPPPPPNQIIFAQLDKGMTDFDLNQAYRIEGILARELFEDPLGTSAYVLNVVAIEPYFDATDDFRQH
jgi:hypothetical protein